jgi:phosphomannomutase
MPLVQSFSGIRGIYDDGLDETVAARYAYSYISLLKNKKIKKSGGKNIKIIVGTDTRPSKDILKNAVIEVLDCDVIDIGIASTPMAEFAVRHFKANGGIIITASHNEPYWNGFKFLDKDGAVLRPNDMEKVIKAYSSIKEINIKIKNKRIIKNFDEINNAYTDYVLNFLNNEEKNKIKNSKLKVIIDPNGGTGIIAKQILEKLNVKVHGINMKHGIFNRTVEPNEDSLIYLANMVREKKYDFAAGFDCDADRVEIMTSKSLVSGNQLLALIANDILENAKNKIVVVNDATSNVVRDIAKKHNAKYIETAVGEINVVDKMYELKAPVGGEGSSSGVIIPPSRCRDGILTLIYLLKIIANGEKNITELIESLPEYYNIKNKIKMDTKNYGKIREKIKSYYKIKNFKVKESEDFGSIKFCHAKSFVWFRTSKTEADLLRIISDSNKKENANLLMEEALQLIKKC